MSDEPRLNETDLLEQVARELRRPVALDPQIEDRVLRALAAERRRPRIDWRAAALAAGLALATGIGVRLTTRPSPAPGPVPAATQPIHLVLSAPASSRVTVVGDFNDWDPRASPMVPSGSPGTWSIRLSLPPGRYRYSFLVDGARWVRDPSTPPALGNDFDAPTSVITVTGGAL
jgi:hypothetical protein